MDVKEAITRRHSVRAYLDKPVDGETAEKLQAAVKECNLESGLHFQLVLDEPKAFDCLLARYGKFTGVKNYVALVGEKSYCFEEKVGYFGEKLALYAQTLGLNTCWVALTYKKVRTAFEIAAGEKLCAVLALGYGATQGKERASKTYENVAVAENPPDWFKEGVKAALLAPTAMNQQKFTFVLDGNKVKTSAGVGFYTKVDLGIAKYHFEVGAGKESFVWA